MKKTVIIISAIIVVLVFLIAEGPFFVLNEGEQAVITRFGKIVRTETEPGFKFRAPFVDTITKYSTKLLAWDGDAQRIPTKENQFIYVDPTSRWIISDPILFYETVKTIENAELRLDDILDSTIRTVISENYLNEAVRNTNKINKIQVSETVNLDNAEDSEKLRNLTLTEVQQETIKIGREGLSNRMYEIASQYTKQYGITLIDIIIRQIRYSDDLTESVYQRMIKERNQIAEAYRSYGRGQLAQWEGRTESEQKAILSQAYAQAEAIKGAADAQASAIYSQAYEKDPEFFELWRTLESYKTTLPEIDTVLTTDLAYFNTLY